MNETIKKFGLSAASGWEIAEHFGCSYMGDMNPIDHDGTFFDARDWRDYDYASCVNIWNDPDTGDVVVECGTINRAEASAAEIAEEYGIPADEVNDLVQIDYARGQWGIEPQEDFEGPFRQVFRRDADDCVDEDALWASISGWLSELGDQPE